MADKLSNHTEPGRFDMQLNGMRQIGQTHTGNGQINGVHESRLGHRQKFLLFILNSSHSESHGGIAVKSVSDHAEINAQNIAFLQWNRIRKTVNNLIVGRSANSKRKTAIPLEGRADFPFCTFGLS